jgi:hypothetical protein
MSCPKGVTTYFIIGAISRATGDGAAVSTLPPKHIHICNEPVNILKVTISGLMGGFTSRHVLNKEWDLIHSANKSYHAEKQVPNITIVGRRDSRHF